MIIRESERERGEKRLILSSLFGEFRKSWTTRRLWFLNQIFHIYLACPRPYRTGPGFDTIPLLGSQGKMSHTSREKLDLVNRTKKVIGQLESILRALSEDEQCADVLQRLAAARGAINSLMAELMEDHIRNHMPRNSKSSEEAAEDLIGIVRTYLK